MKLQDKENIMVQIHRSISDGTLEYHTLPDEIRESYDHQRDRLRLLSQCAEIQEDSKSSVLTQNKKAYRLRWAPYRDPSSFRDVYFGRVLDDWSLAHNEDGNLELRKQFKGFEFVNKFLSNRAPSPRGTYCFDENTVFTQSEDEDVPPTIKCLETIVLRVILSGSDELSHVHMSCPILGAKCRPVHTDEHLDGTLKGITLAALQAASYSSSLYVEGDTEPYRLFHSANGFNFKRLHV